MPPGLVAPTEPDLGLPSDVLDDFGLIFQAQWQMPTDFGRIPVSPGAFDQRPSRMGVPRFGNRPLPAMVASRVLRGNQPQEFHQFSWVLTTRQVADFGHHGDGHGELHTPQGLEGLDHGMQAPPLHLGLQFLFEPLEAVGRLRNRTDVFLKDDLLRCGRTDDFREPSQVGWTLGSGHL